VKIELHLAVQEQRYECAGCQRSFAATKGTPFYRLRTPAETGTLLDDVRTVALPGSSARLGPAQASGTSTQADDSTPVGGGSVTTVNCGATG
jgi:hypothetical protein